MLPAGVSSHTLTYNDTSCLNIMTMLSISSDDSCTWFLQVPHHIHSFNSDWSCTRCLQVSHHIHCNDLELDEDVFSAFPFLRFDARMPRKWFHKYQHMYMVRACTVCSAALSASTTVLLTGTVLLQQQAVPPRVVLKLTTCSYTSTLEKVLPTLLLPFKVQLIHPCLCTLNELQASSECWLHNRLSL